VVAVRGEFDVSTAPRVRVAARDGVVAAGATSLVLDLTAATFLDSTALGVIIGLGRMLRPDGDIAIVNADAGIARTLEMTGLGDIFPVCATRDEAVAVLLGLRP
jgi:anti-sigma B factor antagonist